ncbi:unnamed protein product [Litomosoides sigmodontis]|uniref:ENPP1-3/EXOG-like endonuclease/phosphodiesterase domain-containing protein n=1 Tax=Litomosoides sigmodontis TaxID=42156 RepID=A0A3P6U0T2_LITSI|nr:unnamed protein product [Litomosoides sigmodontis]
MDVEYRKDFQKRQSKLPLFGIILLLMIIGIILAIIFIPQWKHFQEMGQMWSDDGCPQECLNDDFKQKPLLVISFDGFKRSYLESNSVKTLKRMAECGTIAEYMYGTYPTKTFPNHYSIATGLYPESHGIVDNVIYDKELGTGFNDIRKSNDARYFNGVPIWNVLEQQNITTACLFWPACDSPINGLQPTYNLKYNRSMSYRDRIDQIVTWLEMPASTRPLLIMAYFDQPDVVVHFKDEEEISKELENIDLTLDYLFESLESLNCINIIVLSDHGMQKINYRYYLDQMITAENVLFANGVVGQIYFPNETNSTHQDKIMETMEELKCQNNEHYWVYDKRRMPKRYHFSKSNRIGDIILDGKLGTIFHENYEADYNKTHDHGYDFLEEPMHTIFAAYGPNIARSLVLEPFQNIELFNLMIALLNINPDLSPPNNGTEGRLNSVLHDIPTGKSRRLQPMKECGSDDSPESEKACLLGLSLLVSGNNELCYLSNCSSTLQSALIRRSDSTFSVALIERINSDFSLQQSKQVNESAGWITTSLSVKGANDLKVDLHSDFVKGHFTNLEKLTYDYAKLYNDIVVISGPIYDFDDNHFNSNSSSNAAPSHIFRVLFSCKDSQWLRDEFQCENVRSLDALSFILPNVPGDYNCLDPLSYLAANKARLRDIELLTGLEFLPTSSTSEAEFYDDEFSVTLRTMLPEHL